VVDDDLFVRVSDAALIPGPDRRRRREIAPVSVDLLGRRDAEDETFQNRIGRQAIGAMQTGLGDSPAA
jgi:hypothetical protein